MKKGFTLIELLVVIAIIGILAVVILSALSSARKSAADAKRAETVRNVMTAAETYLAQNGTFPAAASVTTLTSAGLLSANPITSTPKYVESATLTPDSADYCIVSTKYDGKSTATYFYAKNGATGTNTTAACP